MVKVFVFYGNVDTRLAKLDRNRDWAAVVLAAAGLIRLGLEARISERLGLDVMLPAPGLGALAATVRTAAVTANRATSATSSLFIVGSSAAGRRKLHGINILARHEALTQLIQEFAQALEQPPGR